MSAPSIGIISVNVGRPQRLLYQGKEVETGIFKEPAEGEIFLSKVNLDGDEQADLVYHGGVEKAVCVYPYEHYAYWTERLGKEMRFGAFGENLTVTRLLEDEVCIGDIFQWGEAVVQVSQPRQPCHKLAKRYDAPELALWVQETGYTGFYFRVQQEGVVGKEHPLRLQSRHPAGITLTYANQIMHQDKKNQEGLKRILAVEELSTSWRQTFTKRLTGEVENTVKRING